LEKFDLAAKKIIAENRKNFYVMDSERDRSPAPFDFPRRKIVEVQTEKGREVEEDHGKEDRTKDSLDRNDKDRALIVVNNVEQACEPP